MAQGSNDFQRLLTYLTEIEGVAEDILSTRREIIDFNRQSNKTREAIRALKGKKDDKKTWLCAGKTFIKVEKKQALSILSKDFEEIDNEVGKARMKLRPQVNKLRDLEKREELKGFDLNPLTKEDLNAVESLM